MPITRNQATRIIDVIDSRIRRFTRSLAMVETTWGEVADVDEGESTVDVYLYGSPYASVGFTVLGGGLPEVGDSVKVAMDKRTGERWVMAPLYAVASGSYTSHDDLTGVSANDHHNENHSTRHADGGADELDILDLPTSETDTDLVLAPDGAGGVEFRTEGGSGSGYSHKGTLVGTTKNSDSNAASLTLTLDATPSTGDVLIATAGLSETTNNITVTQTGVTWTKVVELNSQARTQIWIGVAGSGSKSANVVFTRSGGSSFYHGAVGNWGSSLVGTLVTSTSRSSTGTGDAAGSGPIAPSENAVIVGVHCGTGGGAGAGDYDPQYVMMHSTNFGGAGYRRGCIPNYYIGYSVHRGQTGSWSSCIAAIK